MFDKKTSNYKNKYRLSGRLFADTTTRRFVFYFFFHCTKFFKFFCLHTFGTFAFAAITQTTPLATSKEPNSQHTGFDLNSYAYFCK